MDISTSVTKQRLVKTALHQAVLDCRLHQVRLLVSKHNVNIDSKDVNGRTPLMLTSFIENEDLGLRMAKIFLEAGAFMNVKDSLGRTSLGYACMNGKEKIVQKILSEDVLDINEPDNDGNTPLHHSCSSGNPRIVKMLADTYIRFGINIDRRNNLGYTALLLCCKNGHYASAYMLIVHAKASPTLKDNEFYLNAGDWTKKSYRVKMAASNLFSSQNFGNRAAQQYAISFARQGRMYQQFLMPYCSHSIDNAFRLPPLKHTESDKNLDETLINGEDARRMLLSEIQEMESSRPESYKQGSIRWAMGAPSTAKLRSLSVSNPNAHIPDMLTIFRAYSEQYQPDWRKTTNQSEKVQAEADITLPVPAQTSTSPTAKDSSLPPIKEVPVA